MTASRTSCLEIEAERAIAKNMSALRE